MRVKDPNTGSGFSRWRRGLPALGTAAIFIAAILASLSGVGASPAAADRSPSPPSPTAQGARPSFIAEGGRITVPLPPPTTLDPDALGVPRLSLTAGGSTATLTTSGAEIVRSSADRTAGFVLSSNAFTESSILYRVEAVRCATKSGTLGAVERFPVDSPGRVLAATYPAIYPDGRTISDGPTSWGIAIDITRLVDRKACTDGIPILTEFSASVWATATNTTGGTASTGRIPVRYTR